ncbi:MAG TPA: SAM-dependent methyltransferase [Polyangiaceae bacterium]|jgi:methyltransferase (TIGR00027 family)
MQALASNISDTARWVAVYRAMETERPDALFRDPFASRLAGPRGRDIAARMPKAMRRNVWPMVMRTKAVDDLLADALSGGADRVLNLAAGLDTRPYRLELPPSLVWVEADLPAILAEKEQALSCESPRCRVVREAVDLSDREARRALFDRAFQGARRAVVITEGLLVYWSEQEVRGLAEDLAETSAARTWLTDLVSPSVLRMLRQEVNHRLSPDAEMRFAPADGAAFFRASGWAATSVRSLLREAFRFRRLPLLLRPFALFPEPDPARPGEKPWSCVVRLDRT